MAQRRDEAGALDLALAAELQSALLPKACPDDCPHQVAAARNRMCGSVGGDFYDFIRVNEDQMVFLIGDVVGHGVRASLLMAQLMGHLRSRPTSLVRPVEIVSDLNRTLIEAGERIGTVLPVSLFYAVIDAPTGISFFVNAGHPRPLLCDRDKCQSMQMGPRNLLLGVEECDFVEGCHTFTPGQRLILYTDGVLDAADHRSRHFGEARLREIVGRHAEQSPQACADAVFDAIAAFRNGAPQFDDETIAIIDRV